MRWNRTDWLLLLAITLLGAALRFYAIGQTPPGFQFDEAFNAIDAEQVIDGNRPIFLPANGGREVLYTYFQAGLGELFGETVTTFRLASALAGTAAVAATYLLFRGMLRRKSRWVASFGALALAISYWHIHFSHFGIRVILMPVLFSALFGCYWAAGHMGLAVDESGKSQRLRRIGLYLLAGVILGISVYANPTARFAPLVLAVYTLAVLWRNPSQRRFALDAPLGGLLIAGIAAFLVFSPLGIAFYHHPDWFFGHASEVSVFADRVSGGAGPLAVLAENALHVAGMFSFFGDHEWTHGMAGRPLLDWAIAIPFYLGLVLWGVRLFGRERKSDPDGDALWLLLLWMIAMLAPSVLSDAAPNFSRTLPSLPATVLPIALGLTWIATRDWPRAWFGYAIAGAILCVSLIVTVRDYFIIFPAQREAFYAYDVDKADALAILRTRGATDQVYLSPLWGDHAPVRFLRQGSGIKTLDTADTLAFPQGRGAVYAFPGEETARAQSLATLWPGVEAEVIKDKFGGTLITLVTIDAETAADWPPGYGPQTPIEARFDDGPTLLGAQASGDGPIHLFWRAEAPTYRNLTTFLHLIDADGNRVAQADKVPGNGAFSTPAWSPGERVMDRLYPTMNDLCAGGDSARAVVGWYEYAADGARRPRLGAPGDSAVAGEFTLPVIALAPDQAATIQPQTPLTVTLGDVALDGVTLRTDDVADPGSVLVIDLLGHARDETEALQARVLLSDTVLANFDFGPTGGARQEDVWCQRVRTRIPAGSPVGVALPLTLEVDRPDQETREAHLGELTVAPSTRVLGEQDDQRLAAQFGDDYGLVTTGFDVTDPNAIKVTLTWQALRDPAHSVTSFAQILSPDGVVVAQSDGQPGARRTNRWVEGELVVDEKTLVMPADAPPGSYKVIAGMYDDLSLERLPAMGDANSIQDNAFILGTIERQAISAQK